MPKGYGVTTREENVRKWRKGSVHFSCSVMSDSLRPHGLQHARVPCPSPTPRACSNSSIKSVMPSNHLILCRPLLLLPSVLPRIRVFSNESALHVRWPKYWSFSFNISPSNEHPGLISFKTLILLDQGSILMTLFNLNYLSKGPMSKYSHVGGLGF